MKIFGIILGIIIVLVVLYLFYGITEPPRWIGIIDRNVTDKKITVSGTFGESAKAYTGYSTQYNNEKLYIKIRSTIALGYLPFLKKSGDFIISIPNKNGEIKEVYLQGDNPSENVLIWPKK
jgi:hypothetical protein